MSRRPDNADSAYDPLAPVYDLLQPDVDPVCWAEFVRQESGLHGGIPAGSGDGADGRLIALDLGCGTGSVAVELAAAGYDVVGIDRSPAMLSAARAKADARGIPPGPGGLDLILQDIAAFELFGTVDMAVCLMDTVNHLLSAERVRRLFRLCYHYLNPGGAFILDLATPHHFSETLGDQVFYDLSPDVSLLWKNNWDPVRKISRAELALFLRESDGRYRRVDAEIREKAYPCAVVRRWLTEAGFRVVAAYGGIGRETVSDGDERVFFTAVKPVGTMEGATTP